MRAAKPVMSTNEPDDGFERFRVEPWLDWLGGVVTGHPRLARRFGDLETRRLDTALDAIKIEAPIFVCGLAISGTPGASPLGPRLGQALCEERRAG
jgi:hypothetical protein